MTHDDIEMPEMHIDSGLTFREVQRRAERAQRRDPEISMANTLIELLGEIRHIRAALTALNEGTALFQGAAASRSSVQLEQGAKEVRLSVKLYADSPIGTLGDEAVAEFGRLFRLIEQRQMAGWAESVAALERDGTA